MNREYEFNRFRERKFDVWSVSIMPLNTQTRDAPLNLSSISSIRSLKSLAVLHDDAEPVCAVVDQTCCCSQTSQTAECLCADIGDKSCELSFSKYIQFNFETQLSDSLEFQTKLANDANALYRFGSKGPLLQNIKFLNNPPPPKSGREILHLYSVLVV